MGPSAHLLSAPDPCTPGVWAGADAWGTGAAGGHGVCVCVRWSRAGAGLGVGVRWAWRGGPCMHTLPACALVCAQPRVRARVRIAVRVREARPGDFVGSHSGSVWWEELGRGWAAARTCCNPGLCPPQL